MPFAIMTEMDIKVEECRIIFFILKVRQELPITYRALRKLLLQAANFC